MNLDKNKLIEILNLPDCATETDIYNKVELLSTKNIIFENVLDYTPCSISCVNRDLKYILVNKKLEELNNKSKEDLIGTTVGSNTKQTQFRDFIQDLFDSNKDHSSMEIKTNIGNETFWFLAVAKKFDNGSKIVTIGVDITYLKKYEAREAAVEKMSELANLTSSVAHEINNPLQSITGEIELLELKIGDNLVSQKDILTTLKEILKMTSRIQELSESLRSYSRQNYSEIKCENFEIEDVIKNSLTICSGKIKKGNIVVKSSIQNSVIKANYVLFSQVIVNLISNACDAIKDKDEKWIEIISENTNNSCNISIIDSGNGIDLETQKSMFKPFFTTKSVKEGTGMGLHIAKKTITNFGGDLVIDNNSKNTKFDLIIPINACSQKIKKSA